MGVDRTYQSCSFNLELSFFFYIIKPLNCLLPEVATEDCIDAFRILELGENVYEILTLFLHSRLI